MALGKWVVWEMGREAGMFVVRSAGIAASCINTGVDFSWDRGS